MARLPRIFATLFACSATSPRSPPWQFLPWHSALEPTLQSSAWSMPPSSGHYRYSAPGGLVMVKEWIPRPFPTLFPFARRTLHPAREPDFRVDGRILGWTVRLVRRN